MNLTVFQAGKGDCLLLTSANGHHLLADGGVAAAFPKHIAPALGALRAQGESLDVVYVSHIDDDHIGGILAMLNTEVEWRVHDYQRKQGNTGHRAPRLPRPPEIKAIWNNGFHEQISRNSGPVEDTLVRCAPILSGADDEQLRAVGRRLSDLVTDAGHSLRLVRRAGAKQLNIPLNPEFDGKLMVLKDRQPRLRVGSMGITMIGPTEAELKRLRAEWNCWLRAHKEALDQIRREARADEEDLGTTTASWRRMLTPESLRTPEIRHPLVAALLQAQELGRRAKVKTPNLASLMLLVEEGGKTILLAGDGHADDILPGLKRGHKLTSGRLHVNVFKVPHHGSEHNLTPDFCKAVTADHYLFCANGEHSNPDPRIIEMIVDARAGDSRPFTLWFNSSSAVSTGKAAKAHLRKVEQTVARLRSKHPSRIRAVFLKKGDSFELPF